MYEYMAIWFDFEAVILLVWLYSVKMIQPNGEKKKFLSKLLNSMLITKCSLLNNSSHVFALLLVIHSARTKYETAHFSWTVRWFFWGELCVVSTIVNLRWLLFYANSLHFGVYDCFICIFSFFELFLLLFFFSAVVDVVFVWSREVFIF